MTMSRIRAFCFQGDGAMQAKRIRVAAAAKVAAYIFSSALLVGSGNTNASTITLDFEHGQIGQQVFGCCDGFEIEFSNGIIQDFSKFASFYPGTLSGQLAIGQYVGDGPFFPIVVTFNTPASHVSVRAGRGDAGHEASMY
jgi:hypothetical protein